MDGEAADGFGVGQDGLDEGGGDVLHGGGILRGKCD